MFRFVLQQLVGQITLSEIEDMITTVDKNKDGKISYSEFRVRKAHNQWVVPPGI